MRRFETVRDIAHVLEIRVVGHIGGRIDVEGELTITFDVRI
jgi:hypothetical protein